MEKKFRLLLLLALLLTAATGAWAQTEITTIPNGDFETWTYDGEDMPNYWNSNATSDGSMNGIMGGKQLKRSTDVRPGSSGQYSCSIWSKSTMGVINIGILTSGRIHFGATSSTSNQNYIYSDRDGSNTKNNFTNPCAMPFTGKPTAIKVWVKYVQGGTGYGNYATAKFSAIIHGDADYVAYNLAEHDNDDNKALVVASAEQEIAYNNGEWEQITIPFNYTDNDVAPAYILINAYTNAYPGKGKANDYLYIDDIELEYAAAASSGFTVSLKDGVKDADKWMVKVGDGEAQALPIGGLKGDGSETVTLQYTGRLKVKGVKATIEAGAPAAGKTVDLSTLTADYEAQNGDVLTGETTSYKVTIAAGATVTLDGVNISSSGYCIKCAGDATIILKDGSTNTLTGTGSEYPALSIGDANTTLTIQGSTGVLNVTSGSYCAGIGGGFKNADNTCGNIRIEGGVITAQGGGSGSGIGTDCGRSTCGDIIITGGTITAKGGSEAAGIGTGNGMIDPVVCGDITIANTVTKVTATKGENAAQSIGKGRGGKATCGTVTIGGTLDTDGNPIGGTKYWENNAAVNGGDTYLATSPLIYDPAAPAEATPALSITSPSVGQVIGSDGKNYAYGSLPTGVTAVAKICYVSGSNGLALALTDEGELLNWSTAQTTCAAHTPAFTGGTWKLASKDEWDNMISAAGDYTVLRDGFSSVGGTNLQTEDQYWSSTGYDSDRAWSYFFYGEGWNDDAKDHGIRVRACLAF